MSDLIGNDYLEWSRDDIILFTGATGSGKTVFCFKTLGQYAKAKGLKILYLCNRVSLKEQAYRDIEKYGVSGVFTVATYQQIETWYKVGNSDGFHTLRNYAYVYCDECHYHLSDAKIQNYTDVSINVILSEKLFSNATRILSSATGTQIFSRLISDLKIPARNIYHIPSDYSYVDKVVLYERDELPELIDRILLEEPLSKIIVFLTSAKHMVEMHDIYGDKDAYYCYSKSTRSAELKGLQRYDVTDESFDKRILFATTTIYNGVTFHDPEIRHIFCEIIDVEDMIQCFGRKRPIVGQDDRCSFYICNYSNEDVNRLNNYNAMPLAMARAWIEDKEAFERLHRGNRDIVNSRSILYNATADSKRGYRYDLNEMRLADAEHKELVYRSILDSSYEEMLRKYLDPQLAEKMEKTVSVKSKTEKEIDEIRQKTLEFLLAHEGEILFNEDKQELIEILKPAVSTSVSSFGLKTINGILEDIFKETPFFGQKRIVSKKDRRRVLEDGSENPNRDKHGWMIV